MPSLNPAHWLLPARGRLSADDRRLAGRLGALFPEAWRVGLVHPARDEAAAAPRCQAVTQRAWDLRYRSASAFDALLVGRVPGFGQAGDPRFRSALASCRLLVVLDRAPSSAETSRLVAEAPVADGALRFYRGDGTDPLLRVDDYPTGVRPILEDLSSLHEVLRRIDDAALPFHLGIVPGILEERMLPFLRGLRHVVVAMHGFEHGYAERSRALREAGDPFNQRGTVGAFDEFAGAGYDEVEAKLRAGRDALTARLGRTPRCYIPPTNVASRRTGRALSALGFEYVLSERRIPGCSLPCIASDFYDRSPAFVPGSRPRVACLHATWEADLLRAGDAQSLSSFLRQLVEQRRLQREEVAVLAERVAAALSRG